MSSAFSYMYLDYQGLPCRVLYKNSIPISAELYQPGLGMHPTDIFTVFEEGAVVSKAQYENLCAQIVLSGRKNV